MPTSNIPCRSLGGEERRANAAAGNAGFTAVGGGLRLAAPSFVWAGTVAHNCLRLQEFFDEVGVLFFQTEPCLAYTDDLPAWLADLDLRYHVHLPLDLPWERGFEATWEKIVGLVQKSTFLGPVAYVLHPPFGAAGAPADASRILELLAERLPEAGLAPLDILLENVRESDLVDLWGSIEGLGYGVCLDLGHLLAYDQQRLLGMPGLWERTRMIHAYAPASPDAPATGGGHRHLPLTALDRQGEALLRLALASVRPGTTLLLELFQPEPLFASLAHLHSIMGEAS